MQWGVVNVNDNAYQSTHDFNYREVDFPIEFPHKCIDVLTTMYLSKSISGNAIAYVDPNKLTTKRAEGTVDVDLNGLKLYRTYGAKVAWMAIGY